MPGKQDTVHSYRPTLPITYQYHLKPGESFYKDRNGKVTIVRSRNEQVSKDTRNNWQKKQDSRNAPSIRKQKQRNSINNSDNIGLFTNNVEQYLGKIDKIIFTQVDCLYGLLDSNFKMKTLTKNIDKILEQCTNFPGSTNYINADLYKDNRLIGNIIIDKLPEI